MKKRKYFALVILTILMSLTACGQGDNNDLSLNNGNAQTGVPGNPNVVDNDHIEGTVSGNYTLPKQKEEDGGIVTISRTPRSVDKFKELREQIAKEPHGAAACFVIALHMLMENPVVGEECLAMSVTPSQRDVEDTKRLGTVRQILYDRYYNKDSGKFI